MNQVITKYNLKFFPLLLSMALLLIIFKIDLIVPDNTGMYILKILSVPALSVIILFIAFGKDGLMDIFSKPIKPFKNICVWYLVSLAISFASGYVLKFIFYFDLKSNPGTEKLMETFISLPFVLLFEEVISIFVLLVVANLLFKITKNLLLSQITGVVLSSIFFGLLHYSTYFSVDMFHTLIHIIFIQGLIRIFFNLAALRSNSIIVPWIVHVIFDYTTFGIGALSALLLFM